MRVLERIELYDHKAYAHLLTKSKRMLIDIDDAPFLALAMTIHAAGIWTHGEGLRRQRIITIYTNIDLLKIKEN